MGNKKAAPSSRRKPSQARSMASLNAITEAAAQVLQARGYKGATTNRIAERAGVSVGTLYQYFNDKDEIFNELVRQQTIAYLASLQAVLDEPKPPLKQALRRFLEVGYGYNKLVTAIRNMMRHMPSEKYAKQSVALRQGLHNLVVELLQMHGPFPGLNDLAVTADLMIAQCEGLTYTGRISRKNDEIVDILTESLYRYLTGITAD